MTLLGIIQTGQRCENPNLFVEIEGLTVEGVHEEAVEAVWVVALRKPCV